MTVQITMTHAEAELAACAALSYASFLNHQIQTNATDNAVQSLLYEDSALTLDVLCRRIIAADEEIEIDTPKPDTELQQIAKEVHRLAKYLTVMLTANGTEIGDLLQAAGIAHDAAARLCALTYDDAAPGNDTTHGQPRYVLDLDADSGRPYIDALYTAARAHFDRYDTQCAAGDNESPAAADNRCKAIKYGIMARKLAAGLGLEPKPKSDNCE